MATEASRTLAPSRRLSLRRWVSAAEQGPLDYGARIWLKLLIGLVFVMLYAPILTLIAFSFNDSRRNVVWQGFTTKYYLVAWENQALIEAMGNSLTIAVLCTLIRHHHRRGDGAAAVALPLSLQGCLRGLHGPADRHSGNLHGGGAARLLCPRRALHGQLRQRSDRLVEQLVQPWPLNLSAITISHIAFCFPFVAVVVRARMAGFNRELEEASQRSRRIRMADLPQRHSALHAARPDRRRAACLHPVAR